MATGQRKSDTQPLQIKEGNETQMLGDLPK